MKSYLFSENKYLTTDIDRRRKTNSVCVHPFVWMKVKCLRTLEPASSIDIHPNDTVGFNTGNAYLVRQLEGNDALFSYRMEVIP